MDHFLDRYEFGSPIGAGAYGRVFSARRKLDDMPVAIKRVQFRSRSDWVGGFPFEIYVLRELFDVPGVVKMLDHFVGDHHYYVVMEHASPDLYDVMTVYKYLGEDLCKRLFRDVLRTVIACKDRGFVHNDIKLENVAMDPADRKLKLLDFGLAEFYKPGYTSTFRGTVEFAPPEWTEFKVHEAESSAVWTLGVLLYEISQGPFPADSSRPSFDVPISAEMRDFLESCLRRHNRPKLTDLLEHGWLKD